MRWRLPTLSADARQRLRTLAPTAVWLAAAIAWIHRGVLASGAVLGDAGTDSLRAAWGFHVVADAFPLPSFLTDHAGFPEGVRLLVLPIASQPLGAPLAWVLGDVRGHAVWLLVLLWALGVATAALVERLTRCGASALLAGAAMTFQPITLLAVADGTAEQVAAWAMPAALCGVLALREPGAGRGVAVTVGVLATWMVLDSPYNVAFVLPFLPVVLPGVPRARLLEAAGVAAVGAVFVGILYAGMPLSVEDSRRAGNAIRLDNWVAWEAGRPWETSFAATFIPVATVLGALVLAALWPRRTWPWIAVALVCFLLGLGPYTPNAEVATRLGGPSLGRLVARIAAFHADHPVPIVRFPRRWLLPMALALSVGASLGLRRIPVRALRWALAVPLAWAACVLPLRATGYAATVPAHTPPMPAFTAWVRAHPSPGAFLPLPRVRASNTAAEQRSDLPVFAGLGASLASSDLYWMQVQVDRDSPFLPVGLRTMVRRGRAGRHDAFLQSLDDLTLPHTTGRPIPPSSRKDEALRRESAAALVADGVRFLVIDEAMLTEEAWALLRATFAPLLREERHFDDGTGVRVWVLSAG